MGEVDRLIRATIRASLSLLLKGITCFHCASHRSVSSWIYYIFGDIMGSRVLCWLLQWEPSASILAVILARETNWLSNVGRPAGQPAIQRSCGKQKNFTFGLFDISLVRYLHEQVSNRRAATAATMAMTFAFWPRRSNCSIWSALHCCPLCHSI